MTGNVLIRADASAEIGAGHLMRCIALAQALRENAWQPRFAIAHDLPAVRQRLAEENLAASKIAASPGGSRDAELTLDLAEETGADWTVIDGYQFDAPFQRQLKNSGLRLLCIDDVASCSHYYADAVVNQNISAANLNYDAREPYTKLLLGTNYTLLRDEYLQCGKEARCVPDLARRILITLGGADNSGATEIILRAITELEIEGLELVVLISSRHPERPELERLAAAAAHQVRFVVDATAIAEYMVWADLAVSAGGGTSWELAYLGVPTLMVILADNQEPSVRELARRGAVLDLGTAASLAVDMVKDSVSQICRNPVKRRRLSVASGALVDGLGSRRVAEFLINNGTKDRS
jgi:UDP-2,4-diacetamido-2,4,6-trideoxy-beta-L-altropyranose hydrolase